MTNHELNKKTVTELKTIAEELKLEDISKLKKADLINKIIESSEKVAEKTNKEDTEVAEGILEVLPDGFGFLRSDNYLSGAQDIYVSPAQIRRFNLKTGDKLCGITRAPKEGEKFKALIFVNTVNGDKLEVAINRKSFDQLIPIYPDEPLKLETTRQETATRLIDLIAPIGKGQRGMIVAPPKAGKTVLLKKLQMQ